MEQKNRYKAALLSLGCKVNSYETERIREDMVQKGFEIVDFSETADIYIVNTCSVTNIADRKSRQMLHRARTLNPDAIVVATGCYVQTEKDKEKLDEAADILIGNNHKGNIAEAVLNYIECRKNAAETVIDDIGKEKAVESLSINDYPERSRAFVRIEDGCNQFCSYCIIPYARGRVRSRNEADILDEVRALAVKGFKEVVITGIHISSYGLDNYETFMKKMNSESEQKRNDDGLSVPGIDTFDGTPLLSLVKKISEIEGIERIRLGSLEPRIITKEFAIALSGIKSFCPHFHLSLQSGCNTVLKRMNRHYTMQEFLEKCDILRKVFDRPAITTDVIVGFPGETDEEFEESKEMCKMAGFSKMHIFKYSRRKGTAADKMPGQLTEKIKHERSIELQKLDDKMRDEYISAFLGQNVKVLVEEKTDGYALGLTERYVQVKFKLPADDQINRKNTEESSVIVQKESIDIKYDDIDINDIVTVSVKEANADGILFGELQKNT